MGRDGVPPALDNGSQHDAMRCDAMLEAIASLSRIPNVGVATEV
jgi:hypothetical protein